MSIFNCINVLAKPLSITFKENYILSTLKKTDIVLIHKGYKLTPSDYRHISLESTLMEIF